MNTAAQLRNELAQWFRTLSLALLSLLLFLTPIYLANNFLFDRYSAYGDNLALLKESFAHLQKKKILFIGDSTVRVLHSSEDFLRADSVAGNVSLEGSNAYHWYFLLKHAFALVQPQVLLLGVSTVSMSLDSGFPVDRYHSYLLSLPEIFSEAWNERIGLASAVELLEFKSLQLLHSRAEVMLNLYDGLLPSLRPIVDEAYKGAFTHHPLDPTKTPGKDPQSNLERVVELLRTQTNTKAIFYLSPMSAERRARSELSSNQPRFLELCQIYQLQCWNFAEKYDDSAFLSDGIHLTPEKAAEFRDWLEQEALTQK